MNAWTRRDWLRGTLGFCAVSATGDLLAQEKQAAEPKSKAREAKKPKPVEPAVPWPPELPGAKNGTVALHAASFLSVPPSVAEARAKEGAAAFTVAETPPEVELAYHRDLGPEASKRRLWSSWGDICIARDGRAYAAIGDHGGDAEGDARCFLYRWDPRDKTLTQIVDMNQVVPPRAGQPAWSKVHAKIDEGADGKIYFSCTLNDGQRARTPKYAWTESLPGGQLYQFDPATGKASVFANLPPKRCTATSLLDRERNVWWCNLEAGESGDALWGLDLATKQTKYQTADGAVKFNRNFALARDGSVYFNGDGGLRRFDPQTKESVLTKAQLASGPGMRCTSHESKAGWIYGITHQTHQLFRFSPAKDAIEMLGANWLAGSYTAVCALSPDERFLYYLPGSHGGAFKDGTPVVQYDVATGRRKALAFLAETFDQQCGYVPAGTYGMKVSADGASLLVNFNGHPSDRQRPASMKPNGFGLCAFAAIHIPPSER